MDTTATEATVYNEGNAWQKDRYGHMTRINVVAGMQRFGVSSKGTHYKHLLHEDNALHNFLGDQQTLKAVQDRFKSHKAGDKKRVLTNMAASQPCCFNLFAPLWRDRQLTDALFSKLLNKPVHVEHLEIEFTPNTWAGVPGFELHGDESIGDQSDIGGTDADVAVFYTTNAGKRGVVLIEFKYIEAEFSVCSSYKKKAAIRTGCDAADWYAERIAPNMAAKPVKPDCGYLKYNNWQLLEDSSALDAQAVKALPGCPFKGSLNQLWRNMLLAERVAEARKLDEFHFWVLSPVENTFLWQEQKEDVEAKFRAVLTEQRSAAYRRLELDNDVMTVLENLVVNKEQAQWLQRFRLRYLVEHTIP